LVVGHRPGFDRRERRALVERCVGGGPRNRQRGEDQDDRAGGVGERRYGVEIVDQIGAVLFATARFCGERRAVAESTVAFEIRGVASDEVEQVVDRRADQVRLMVAERECACTRRRDGSTLGPLRAGVTWVGVTWGGAGRIATGPVVAGRVAMRLAVMRGSVVRRKVMRRADMRWGAMHRGATDGRGFMKGGRVFGGARAMAALGGGSDSPGGSTEAAEGGRVTLVRGAEAGVGATERFEGLGDRFGDLGQGFERFAERVGGFARCRGFIVRIVGRRMVEGGGDHVRGWASVPL